MTGNNFIAAKSGNLFEEFILSNSKYRTISFFRKVSGGHLIVLKIMHHHVLGIDLHIENLIEQIPTSIVSRQSIFACIDNAVKENFLIKIEDLKDKRKRCIKPSEILIKEYKEWLMEFVKYSS